MSHSVVTIARSPGNRVGVPVFCCPHDRGECAQMKRTRLLLPWCAWVVCAGLAAGSAEGAPHQTPVSKATSHRSRLVPARFFADPANRQFDIQGVRENMERSVTLAGHYSQSVVSCGIGCISFWIVDRRTGAVLDLPRGARDAQYVEDVRGRRESDIIRVIFGSSPTHDRPARCRSRSYRLRDTRFTAIGGFSPVPCP